MIKIKKIITVVSVLLITSITFGQKKSNVLKKPSFKITYDKFESKFNYNANAGSIGIFGVGSSKDFADVEKYLTLTLTDTYLTHASDLILLFSDGTKMTIDTETELGDSAGNNTWRYYTLMTLSKEQWLELSNKTIVSYKYHIFERNYKYGIQLKTLVNYFFE